MNALKNSDKDHFEVAFHDLERKLLASAGGCVLKVVKLMKYLRDITGGTTLKLKSHFIKVYIFRCLKLHIQWYVQSVVMAHVLREENTDYWNNGNLAKCFFDCTMNLYFALQKQILWDIFYPEVNDWIHNLEIKSNCNASSWICLTDLKRILWTKPANGLKNWKTNTTGRKQWPYFSGKVFSIAPIWYWATT